MRSIFRPLAVAAALFAVAPALQAADLPENRWSDSAEIVVPSGITIPGMRRCPGMWKLKRGASALYIMATLTTVPDHMSWDSSCLNKLMNGANQIFLPGAESSWTPQSTRLPNGVALATVVSSPTYARFTAMAERDSLPLWRFKGIKPQWAGAFLMGQVYRAHGLRGEAYPSYISSLARDKKLPVQTIFAPDDGEKFGNMRNALDAPQAEACLTSYLDLIDYDLAVRPRMAEAWGRADMAAVLKDHREIPAGKCLPPDSETVALAAASTAADTFVRPLDEALNRPGKAIAVIPLSLLLRQDGVLDRLKATGVDVVAPAAADDFQ